MIEIKAYIGAMMEQKNLGSNEDEGDETKHEKLTKTSKLNKTLLFTILQKNSLPVLP